jgi:hypothetical protein
MSNWVVACGGTEPVMTVKGRRIQYMWNKKSHEHAYYDLGRDLFLNDEDVKSLGMAV